MKKSIWRKQFDPTAKFVVRKKLRFGGKSFKRGAPFTPKTSKRQLRILYFGRFIDYAPTEVESAHTDEFLDDIGNVITEVALAEDVTDPPADDSQTTQPVTDQIQTTEPDPGPQYRLAMAGRGWYNVLDANDDPINDKKLRLKDAEKLLNDKR